MYEREKRQQISFHISVFGICWWQNSAFVLNKTEVEHLSELKCILGTQKITDIIPENGICWHDYAKCANPTNSKQKYENIWELFPRLGWVFWNQNLYVNLVSNLFHEKLIIIFKKTCFPLVNIWYLLKLVTSKVLEFLS